MSADPDIRLRLRDHIRAERLFPEGGLALLAVSGGPDSVALLDLLYAIAADAGLVVAVAHVDHGILPESLGLAEQVRGIATRYGVAFHAGSLRLGPGTSETRARRERYRVLRGIQAAVGARYLVTAHHADDQIETVLLRLLKGSGIAGLAAIPALGPRGLVRPLLPFRRRELAAHVEATGLPVFQDPTNADLKGERARIRHELLPRLRERFGDRVDQRLLRLVDHATRERRAWSAVLRSLPDLALRVEGGAASIAREPLRRYPDDLAQVLLRGLALEVGCVVGPKRGARLLRFARQASSGRVAQLGEHWVAELVFDRLRLLRRRGAALPPCGEWGDGESGSITWDGWEITWRRDTAGKAGRLGLATWVTPGAGEIRGSRPGDRLRPFGATGRRPVRRLFMEARVPAGERAAYPVLVRDGEIVWVPGICRAAGAVPPAGAPAVRLEARRVGEPGQD